MSAESNHVEPFGKHYIDSSDGKESGHGADISSLRGFHRRKNSVELFPPQMTNKMKGLFKGLRYISQIFDPSKEPEMQIGHPTDVKHVAHIGWDGPSVTPPSWMGEFRSTPEFSSAPLSIGGEHNESPSHNINPSFSGDLPELPKPSRRHQSADGSRSREGSTRSKNRDTSDMPAKPRRHKEGSRQGSTETATAGTDAPGLPKSSHRRKSKASSSGGSVRSSRTKALTASSSDLDTSNAEQFAVVKGDSEESDIK